MAASVTDTTVDVEPRRGSRGRGDFNKEGPPPVSAQAYDVDVSPEIAPVPFNVKCTRAPSSEVGMVFT